MVSIPPISPSSNSTTPLLKEVFFQQRISIMSLPYLNLSVTPHFPWHKAQIPQQGPLGNSKSSHIPPPQAHLMPPTHYLSAQASHTDHLLPPQTARAIRLPIATACRINLLYPTFLFKCMVVESLGYVGRLSRTKS